MLNKPTIADGVAFVVRVLTTIDLDNEPFLPTREIDDIRSDRLLTHEFEPAERPGAKVAPELSFSGRRLFPQLPSQSRLRYVGTAHVVNRLTPSNRRHG